jgi:hypothetical protein
MKLQQKHSLFSALGLCFVALLLFPAAGLSQQKPADQTVRVEVDGASPFEARQEAIRQALQMTMKQLVVADRAIENDQVIRDRVISTMNGYVRGFQIVSSERRQGQVHLVADVTVSPSAIKSFVESSNLNGVAKTSADSLIADAAREVEARRARTEMLISSFSQFPASAMSSQIVKMTPNTVDPEFVDVWVQVQFDKAFVTSVKQQIAAMSQGVKRPDPVNAATPNVVLICFSSDGADSIDGPAVLAQKQFDAGVGACSVLPGIDPASLQLRPSSGQTRSQELYSVGLVALATGFGSEQEIPAMSLVAGNQMLAYVVNRNRGVDKVMRGLGIANRLAAGLNGRKADTSNEDPSLFCTQDRVIAGSADQCRLQSQNANLMMLALQPNNNPRALWIWMDTRPRLFYYKLSVSSVKPGMTRYVGMPFLDSTKHTLRSLFPFNDPPVDKAEDLKLLEADFKLYALRNDADDANTTAPKDDGKSKPKK